MTSFADGSQIQNLVLRSLRSEARDFLSARLLTREIRAGEIIYEDGAPFTHAVFPHEGLLSLLADEEDGRVVEKASIGLEGFLGFVLLLGGGTAISKSVVTVPGYASWLSIRDLDEALERFECVRRIMLLYAKYLIRQLMESVACNSLHSADQRVTRWLMHAADRVPTNEITVTQQAIADALGIRRATVNEIISNLRRSEALDFSRGKITVLNRSILEQKSCKCYARIRHKSLWKDFETVDSPLR